MKMEKVCEGNSTMKELIKKEKSQILNFKETLNFCKNYIKTVNMQKDEKYE
ncbi:MAG: hypothetical protein J7J15_00670 [Candidatus Aenigmarchaeota archaeon]|nr:hypothetical protein [Candidatus Aenigmarchaeota archaeon]